MEDHLKRALIEVYYAIAEFDQEKAMTTATGDASETHRRPGDGARHGARGAGMLRLS